MLLHKKGFLVRRKQIRLKKETKLASAPNMKLAQPAACIWLAGFVYRIELLPHPDVAHPNGLQTAGVCFTSLARDKVLVHKNRIGYLDH